MSAISEALDLEPILCEGAEFGWCKRRRLVWTDVVLDNFSRGLVDIETFEAKGWNTLAVPTQFRLPPLWEIFASLRVSPPPLETPALKLFRKGGGQ